MAKKKVGHIIDLNRINVALATLSVNAIPEGSFNTQEYMAAQKKKGIVLSKASAQRHLYKLVKAKVLKKHRIGRIHYHTFV